MNADDFRIVKIWRADKNILWVHIEGPSKRWNHRPELADDKVFYIGMIGAYQVDTQIDLMDKVLGNIIYPAELKRKLSKFEELVEKYKALLESPNLGRPLPLSEEQYEEMTR